MKTENEDSEKTDRLTEKKESLSLAQQFPELTTTGKTTIPPQFKATDRLDTPKEYFDNLMKESKEPEQKENRRIFIEARQKACEINGWSDWFNIDNSELEEHEKELHRSTVLETATHILADRISSLEAEVKEREKDIKDQGDFYRELISINVANGVFDGSDKDWREQHNVLDGESFPHWYMRLYNEKIVDLRADKESLQAEVEKLKTKNEALKTRW